MQLKTFYEKYKQRIWLSAVGFSTVLIYMLPNLILGQDAYFRIQDNLDSEIIFNELYAKYFFDFSGTVPELMNVDVKAINTFSIFQILFYAILPPLPAYLMHEFIIRLVAFFGMYLAMDILLKGEHKFANIATCIIFSVLPILSVYGLTVVGIPLVFWAFVKIYRRENLVPAFIAVAFFAVASSLILIGYFIVAIAGVMSLVFLCKKSQRKRQIPFYIATALLIIIYLVCNIKMLMLMFGGYESHRAIWAEVELNVSMIPNLDFMGFVAEFYAIFAIGHIHVGSFHLIVLMMSLATLLYGLTKRIMYGKTFSYYRLWKILCNLFLLNILIVLFSAFAFTRFYWNISVALHISEIMINRVFHVTAFTWYAAGGISFAIILQSIKLKIKKFPVSKAVIAVLAVFCVIFVNNTFMSGLTLTPAGNVSAVFGKENSDFPTYRQFYETKLMGEIDKYITETYGMTKTEYRVGSIAMEPAVAIYNGFYTVDGYVQLYSLEYWRKFYKIIENEIKDTDYLERFYWGNRCLLYTTEIDRWNYYEPKTSDIKIESLDYGIEGIKAFKELGGEFIFSAIEIVNYAENGLEFCQTFEHSESWYKIWLYKVAV